MYLERNIDLAILGGGPAALFAAVEALSHGIRPAIISDQLGGCMAMMGTHPLQSYPDELRFGNARCDLNDYLPHQGSVTINGGNYAKYIANCISRLPVEHISAEVTGFERGRSGMQLHLSEGGKPSGAVAQKICIATGLLPKPHGDYAPAGKTITCFEAYRELSDHPRTAGLGRHVIVVGSGNSAFQLALGYSKSAKSVTILANRWHGVFPLDTDDRFALRGISQLTIERIVKSYRTDASCPFNPAGQRELAPIAVYIHDRLCLTPDQRNLRVALHARRNLDRIPALCFHAGVASGQLKPLPFEEDMFTLCFPTEDILMVSAIGVRARLPENPFSDLLNPETGFIPQDGGQTAVPEIFAVGACVGDPSVNTMRRPKLKVMQ